MAGVFFAEAGLISAQNNQDCFSAIKVCTNTYIQNASNTGYGSVKDIDIGESCLGTGETNSTWYTFKIKTAGNLSFQIVPVNVQDDYDFVLYNITSAECSDIANGSLSSVRCNFSSTEGSTGLCSGYSSYTSSSGDPNQNAPLNVVAEEVYALMVNNFTATNAGYTLTFSGTAIIYDTEAPEFSGAEVSTCSPASADLHFSEDIDCTTIAANGSDFTITGPAPVIILSATGTGCSSSGMASFIRIRFSPITVTGTYKIKITKGTDANSVSDFCGNMIQTGKETSFTVNFTGPSVSINNIIHTDCHNTGLASVNASGGSSPYIYSWNSNPVQTSQTAQNLSPGKYICTVTDANGCSASVSATIQLTGAPQLQTSVQNATCDSLTNGSATTTATGGIPPFTFQWNTAPPQYTATATALQPGIYIVTITDSGGCTYTDTAIITATGQPVITTAQTNVSCDGNIKGTASASSTGTGPFSYQWSTGVNDTLAFISGLPQGTYTVTVTDSKGCSASKSITLQTGGMQLTTSATGLTCATIPTGTATVNAQNGNPPYIYTWLTNPVQHDSVATQLPGGIYTVIVTDAGGCSDSAEVTVPSPSAISINVTITNADCGQSNGAASANTTGGVAPYTFLWSTNPVQNTISAGNLFAGIYSVTVTDNTGCSATSAAYIGNPNGPQGFISGVKDATCNLANGSASVTNVTGTAPFTYTWNTVPRQYHLTASNLAAGIYYVMIRDAHSCVSFLNVKINAIEPATLSLASATAASCGKADGQAIVYASGGATPYQFLWNTIPSQSQATAILPGGVHTCILTDGNNCKIPLTVTIPEKKAHNDFTFTPACDNEPVHFTGFTDFNEPVTWQWDFGDGNSYTEQALLQAKASHVFPSDSFYLVTLYINGGCATDTLRRNVKGAYRPEASFITRPNHIYATAPVEFIYTGTAVSLYEWVFDPEHIIYSPHATFTFDTPGDTAHVQLQVTDQYGCRDTADGIYYIDQPPSVFIPSGFTPNGDGLNDLFIIPSYGMRECKLQIVNRWGAVVYTCDNASQMMNTGWNGTSHSQPTPAGSYTYLLTGSLENGKPVFKTGTITLLR